MPAFAAARPVRRRMRSAERQDDILDRTQELLAQEGVAQLSMKKIAQRVGFSEAAMYRHFPTKRDLLLGLLARVDARFLTPAEERAGDLSLPVQGRLADLLHQTLGAVVDHHSLLLLIFVEAASEGDPVLLARLRGIFQRVFAVFEGQARLRLGARRRRGGAIHPDSLALVLFGVNAGLAIHHRLLRDARFERRAARELPRHLEEVLFQGAGEGNRVLARR